MIANCMPKLMGIIFSDKWQENSEKEKGRKEENEKGRKDHLLLSHFQIITQPHSPSPLLYSLFFIHLPIHILIASTRKVNDCQHLFSF